MPFRGSLLTSPSTLTGSSPVSDEKVLITDWCTISTISPGIWSTPLRLSGIMVFKSLSVEQVLEEALLLLFLLCHQISVLIEILADRTTHRSEERRVGKER